MGLIMFIRCSNEPTGSNTKLRLKTWPFNGPAILREGRVIHVIDAWCHLGTAEDETDMHNLLEAGKPAFDRDTYRILLKHLPKMQPLTAQLS